MKDNVKGLPEPYYSEPGITLYHGDCREILPLLDAPLLVTDPDYGTGGWKRERQGAGRNPRAIYVREEWDHGVPDWLRFTSAQTVMTFWPACTTLALLSEAVANGFGKHTALYMRKLDPRPTFHSRLAYSMEPIWILCRGESYGLSGGTDVCDASTPRANRDADATGHPYQKPLKVMQWLLSKRSDTSLVDPFMGSGSTLLAAKNLGKQAIGIELEEKWCEIAAQRLAQEVLPLDA